jgi:two-component system cell cycle sensor histidine kinase/response regulator CckA
VTGMISEEKQTILIVDDEPLVRDFLVQGVSAAGFNALQAASGSEAVQIARSFPGLIHLVIIDQILEDNLKGVDIAAEISSVQPNARVLYISGYQEPDVLGPLAGAAGTFAFLQKPFSFATLLERIRQLLRRANTGNP